MKIAELEGTLLDYWVAKAKGGMTLWPGDEVVHTRCGLSIKAAANGELYCLNFRPSTDWSHGGPIIEREGIGTAPDSQGPWKAYKEATEGPRVYIGRTPLEAAMRRFVASKYGENVPCPDKE